MMLLPCRKCRERCEPEFYFVMNDVYDCTTDESGRFDQCCSDCIAKTFKKLNCSGCSNFLADKNFSSSQLARGRYRRCQKCDSIGEGKLDEDLMFVNRIQCRTCDIKAVDTPTGKLSCCANCGRVRYCSRECQIKDWCLRHREECPKQKEIVERFKAEG
ncbi:hypothetical protein HDU99_000886, partial [Rhizoclosmatium hyalinum]